MINTFDEAVAAWLQGKIQAFDVPNYIESEDDAWRAHELGIIDEEAVVFFETMVGIKRDCERGF